MAAASRGGTGSKSPKPLWGPVRRDPPAEARPADVAPASPISLGSLEIVERARPGLGFVNIDDTDSFAMEDPPSEEVRLDPRFNRVSDAATELIDRGSLISLIPEASEEELAGPPPHPDELTNPPRIPLEAPMPRVPTTVGPPLRVRNSQVPGPVRTSAPPAPTTYSVSPRTPESLDQELGGPLSRSVPSTGDLQTDVVPRVDKEIDELPLFEITKPSTLAELSEAWDEVRPEVTRSSAGSAPDEVPIDRVDPTPNPLSSSSATTARRADSRSPDGPKTRTTPQPPTSQPPPRGTPQPPPNRTPTRATPAPAPSRSAPSKARPAPVRESRDREEEDDDGPGFSPVIGIVALLGSGSVLAGAVAIAVLAVGVALWLAFSSSRHAPQPEPALPPIETPVLHSTDADAPAAAPAEAAPEVPAVEPAVEPVEAAPAPAPAPRPSPAPAAPPQAKKKAPVAKPAPAAPAPVPVAAPAPRPPPHPIVDLDDDPVVVPVDDGKGHKKHK